MDWHWNNDKLAHIINSTEDRRYPMVANGKERMTDPGYYNMPNFVFVKDDMLCLANMVEKFSFPLDGIAGISKVSKKIPLLSWNKGKDS